VGGGEERFGVFAGEEQHRAAAAHVQPARGECGVECPPGPVDGADVRHRQAAPTAPAADLDMALREADRARSPDGRERQQEDAQNCGDCRSGRPAFAFAHDAEPGQRHHARHESRYEAKQDVHAGVVKKRRSSRHGYRARSSNMGRDYRARRGRRLPYLQQLVLSPEQQAALLYAVHIASRDSPAMAVASAGFQALPFLPAICRFSR
jgi:hypothetical protein